jgi:hypothetical protein
MFTYYLEYQVIVTKLLQCNEFDAIAINSYQSTVISYQFKICNLKPESDYYQVNYQN